MQDKAEQTSVVGDMETGHTTLSQYLLRAKQAISRTYSGPEKIISEISSIKNHANGNVYIELAEYAGETNERRLIAKVSATVMRSNRRILTEFEKHAGEKLAAGMKVLIEIQTTYQEIWGMSVNIVGIDHKYTMGDMAALVTEIREKLVAEGIYNRNKSRPQPFDYYGIGIIAPSVSAGLEDFNKKLENIPDTVCQKRISHCVFQSDKAGDAIAVLIENMNKSTTSFDAILVIRGGGGKSDLNYLNHERLARQICLSRTPVYVGIGHETDRTILDEVANRSFSTPSMVANFISEHICQRAQDMESFWLDISREAMTRLKDKEGQYRDGWASLCASVTELSNERESRLQAHYHDTMRLSSAYVHKTENELLSINSSLTQGVNRAVSHIEIAANQSWQDCQRQGLRRTELMEGEIQSAMDLLETSINQTQRDLKDNEERERLNREALLAQQKKHRAQLITAGLVVVILMIIILILWGFINE